MEKHRKLYAIMFTDIVAYTAIMSKDEQKALYILHKNRDIQKAFIKKFNGEWLKEMGDGTLSSFSSVVDAVNCALQIQNSLRDEPDFKLRIGIHIGDVVVDKGDVFGDGVNVASRIEFLAEPGGICISERVYYDISNKPDIETVLLGEKRLKNVDRPMNIYALRTDKVAATSTSYLPEEKLAKVERRVKRQLVILAAIGIIVLIVVYSVFICPATQKESPITIIESIDSVAVKPTAPDTVKKMSIAVLPFVDMSADKNQEYFCDGMTEEIINTLSKVKGLRVIARNSTFTFKNKEQNIKDIGTILNVDKVLGGSVRKSGNRLLVTANLNNVSDQSILWSDKFERETKDILTIQEEISLDVLNKLDGWLSMDQKHETVKSYTSNVEAYNLYLTGRYYWNMRDERMIQGIEYFKQAIEKDPNYALAYTGIADSYNILGLTGHVESEEAFKNARYASEKALQLDDAIAESHATMGWLYLYIDWDWSAAESSFKRAIELNFNYASAHHWYHDYHLIMRQFDKALSEIKEAEQLDPLSQSIQHVLVMNYRFLKRYDEAIEEFYKIPESYARYTNLGDIYLDLGEYEKALENYQKDVDNRGAKIKYQFGYFYAVSGNRHKAEQILKEMKKDRNTFSYHIAIVYAGLGEKDKVFEFLEKSYENHEFLLPYINFFPEWEPIRSDPRFKVLLKKIGLPTY